MCKTGLDVVRDIGPEAMPATIFVTAYDQYALKAFELSAVDYLVKPFDDERFEQAFRRARRMIDLARPTVVIANTVKGRGVSFAENTNSWHYGKLTEDQKVRALGELAGIGGSR